MVLDLVPNHSSDKHPWFEKGLQGDEKYKNYYMWAEGKNKDDKTPPNNWLSVFSGSAWEYVDSQKQWYFHQFDYRQPDLNFSNPDVREEMKVSFIEESSVFLKCCHMLKTFIKISHFDIPITLILFKKIKEK